MDEISNKTLAVLVLGAIVVSLVGTLLSVSRLGLVKPGITGYQTAEGNVTLSLNTDTTISVVPYDLAFGNGRLTEDSSWGILSTNASGKNYYNVTGFANHSTGFNITNEGNVRLNITVTSDKNCSEFIGFNDDCKFGFWVLNKTGAACNSTNTRHYKEFNETAQTVCQRTQPEAGMDELQLNIYIKMSQHTPTGSKIVTLTFNSAASQS
jgi:hypothetical protein